ncbi:MAG: hypothetical protein JRI71_07415 [Deltaproteobacteria bacterium]|nr:hypothetical protein [Deltaproteobacteria bacterium]MBW2077363.1 hypothetical protein [Deltaproteobacteria bacterium]
MKNTKVVTLIIIAGLALGAFSCQTITSKTGPKATLEVIPAETYLSPALIKKPISFKGSGFQPKEMVSVEMILPPGLKMKGVQEGEDVVGIAFATADDKGNFTAAMAPTATLNWLFQVGWTPLLKPNFKEAKPIPPGVYRITATGLDTDRIATATLKIVPPPKKK